jgi:hypothetical protein
MFWKIFDIVATIEIFWLAIVFFVTFLIAFFNGNQVLVDINHFGEAWWELVLFSLIIISGFILIIRKIRSY